MTDNISYTCMPKFNWNIIVLILSYLLLCYPLSAQTFLRTYGDDQDKFFMSSVYSAYFDQFFVFGQNGDIPSMSRVDRNGNVIWTRYYPGSYYCASIAELQVPGQAWPDVVISLSKFPSFMDIHILRINGMDGSVVWGREIMPSTPVRFPHVAVTSDNKIIANGVNFGNLGMFYIKLDESGNTLWTRRYLDQSASEFSSVSFLVPDFDGGVVMGANNQPFTGFFSITKDGDVKMFKRSDLFYIFRTIQKTSDGFLVPSILNWTARGRDHALLKMDRNFNLQWAKTINPEMSTSSFCNGCTLPGAIETSSGDILYIQESLLPGYEAFSFLKFSGSGEFQTAFSFEDADVRLVSFSNIPGGFFSVSGGTTRSSLCLPGDANEKGLFGVFANDLEICDAIEIKPDIQNLNITFSDVPASNIVIINEPATINAMSTASTLVNFAQAVFCSEDEDFIDLGPDIFLCADTTLLLNAGSGYSDYLWSTGATTATIGVNQSGLYSVRVTTLCGDILRDTVEVKLNAPLRRIQDIVLCEGQSFSIGGNIYTESGQYADTIITGGLCDSVIMTNLTILGPVITELNEQICEGTRFTVGGNTYGAPGFYTNLLTSSAGCDSTVNLNLSVAPNFTVELADSICQGEQYLFAGQTLASEGIYEAVLVSAAGCDSVVTLALKVWEVPQVEANASRSPIFGGESVELSARPSSSAYSYVWSPAAQLADPFSSSTLAAPQQSTWFFVTLTDEETACSTTDSVLVQVFDPCSFVIPTAFTPNGDGVNDCYRLLGLQDYQSFELSIYNRWGEKVFFSNDPRTCWDGSASGVPLPMDGYLIYARYLCKDTQWVEQKGSVLLIR